MFVDGSISSGDQSAPGTVDDRSVDGGTAKGLHIPTSGVQTDRLCKAARVYSTVASREFAGQQT